MNSLFVAGRFDDAGGKPSGYAEKLSSKLRDGTWCGNFYNGGTWYELVKIMNEQVPNVDVVYWFADVPNDKNKLVRDIKQKNQKCILITSKRNNGEYIFQELIAKALQNKSNLVVEFNKNNDIVVASVFDPLGNMFLKDETNIGDVAASLGKRVKELLSFTRVGSVKTGESKPIPNQETFFKLVAAYADRFHELIHGVHTTRLLGNASFRCERGFPSFRGNDGLVYISRRDIDKRFINRDGFVAVERYYGKNLVKYYGDFKPSVDTPIQNMLYWRYPDINYAIHSHVYIKDAHMTKSIIPCGAIEEYDEIVELFVPTECSMIKVNLRGHGSLVMASRVEDLENIEYIPRVFPEMQK